MNDDSFIDVLELGTVHFVFQLSINVIQLINEVLLVAHDEQHS